MSSRVRETLATPTHERAVTSYPARRRYRPGVIHPPEVPGVKDAIDVHCHAHQGQQDPLSLAKLASKSEMGGILFKSLGPFAKALDPMATFHEVEADLLRWADEKQIVPTRIWAGYCCGATRGEPSVTDVRAKIESGVIAIWLPIENHANSYHKVGAKAIWLDKSASPDAHTAPLPWDEAKRLGHYFLNENGKLKTHYAEIIRVAADLDTALFYGHATHPEIEAVTELVTKLNFKRAVIDHPFSPFIDLSVGMMKDLTDAGIYLNFTYDELSPLLGVDPQKMYDAIRAIGVERVTLSSDAGEPLFPNSVECMRLIGGMMEAFGLTPAEIRKVMVVNPAHLVKLP